MARALKSFLEQVDYLERYQKPQTLLMSLTHNLSYMSVSLISWKDLWLQARNRKICKEQHELRKQFEGIKWSERCKSLPKSDLMDGLFDLEGFFFSSAARQEDGKVTTKEQYPTKFKNILECKMQSAPQTNTKKDFAFQHNPANLYSTFLPERTCNLVDVKLWFDILFQ